MGFNPTETFFVCLALEIAERSRFLMDLDKDGFFDDRLGDFEADEDVEILISKCADVALVYGVSLTRGVIVASREGATSRHGILDALGRLANETINSFAERQAMNSDLQGTADKVFNAAAKRFAAMCAHTTAVWGQGDVFAERSKDLKNMGIEVKPVTP